MVSQLLDPRQPKNLSDLAVLLILALHVLLAYALPRSVNRPVLVHCAGGYRSSIAAGILQRHGRANLTELTGGLGAWEAAGLPVIS